MNNFTFIELNRKASQLRSKYYYKSVIKLYEDALVKYPEHTILISYNLGAIYQTELGYGDKAKEYYLQTIKWHENNLNYIKMKPDLRKKLDDILAATYENITLLSDSYEEIYEWADKLWTYNPLEQNLKENIKKIKDKQSIGKPWKETYFETAGIFYNVDPNLDRGLYGFAASIFRRLSLYKNQLKLDRTLYEFSTNGYGALMQKILYKIISGMKEIDGNVEINEISFIFEDSISLLSDYLEINPNDSRVLKTIELLNTTITKYKNNIKTNRNTNKQSFTLSNITQVIGETRCQNQIVITSKNQAQIIEIVEDLSEILLTPFKKSLDPNELMIEKQKEYQIIMKLYGQGGQVSIYYNNVPAQNTFCLVGNESISALSWIFNALGMEQTTIPNINRALQYFKQALEESPDYSYAIYNIATCYVMKGEFREAVHYYEKAHNIYPDDAEIYNELMQCRSELQQENEDIIQYNKNDFRKGSPYYNEKDDHPPRCRSCGSTNLNFTIASGYRYWICLDCGRHSGKAAAYDPVTAVPAPHNDSTYLKSNSIEIVGNKPIYICPYCGSTDVNNISPIILECGKCKKTGPSYLFINRNALGTGCMYIVILIISIIGVLLAEYT
ncbi:MAG: tetratricopeptide repeat protein [Candidatus Cloacimonetes bacterium]|nr:tetratricopeptide repeat protein [Candidatus Cloacimonadota bacterium]